MLFLNFGEGKIHYLQGSGNLRTYKWEIRSVKIQRREYYNLACTLWCGINWSIILLCRNKNTFTENFFTCWYWEERGEKDSTCIPSGQKKNLLLFSCNQLSLDENSSILVRAFLVLTPWAPQHPEQVKNNGIFVCIVRKHANGWEIKVQSRWTRGIKLHCCPPPVRRAEGSSGGWDLPIVGSKIPQLSRTGREEWERERDREKVSKINPKIWRAMLLHQT